MSTTGAPAGARRRPLAFVAAVMGVGSLIGAGASAGAAPSAPTTLTSEPTTTSTTSPTTKATHPVDPSASKAAPSRSSLRSGATLNAGGQLVSSSKAYTLAMQTDGNLVLYGPGGALWQSGTANSTATHLTMQSNGDLVVATASDVVVWSSHTSPGFGLRVRVVNAGAFEITTPGKIPVWRNGASTGRAEDRLVVGDSLAGGQSLVSLDGAERLALQGDGNLVAYSGTKSTFSTNTAGSGATLLAFQDDGNLVLYGAGGRPIWWSGTTDTSANAAVIQRGGVFVISGPPGPLWINGTSTNQISKTVGVYAYPTPSSALAAGWPFIGVTGAVGTCSSPFVGQGYVPHHGNDEETGFAIQKSGRSMPWLSFWTVSGPTVPGSCAPAANQSPGQFYKIGKAAGAWVATRIDRYAADGLHIKPDYVIFDGEGYPDNHSGLNGGINNPRGTSALETKRWFKMLDGWTEGLHSVDPSLNSGFYANQAEYRAYHLALSPLPAFIAVAFGYRPSVAAGRYPLIDPVRLPGVDGSNIKGFIAFFAGPPHSVACTWVRREAGLLASWGAPLNTLQFDPGRSCPP
ncbi:MAG: hypothetical protein WCI12_03135 [Actinomycetes bacterium]